jgi:hypothetical protein
VQVKQGRLNFTTMVGIPEGAAVMTGTFSIQNKPIKILFDYGATHNFINEKAQSKLRIDTTRVKDIYKIVAPGGNVTSNTINDGVPLKLGSKVVFINLITLGLEGVDVILGMDWMTQHKVTLDITERRIEINSPVVGTSTLYLPLRESVNPRVPSVGAFSCFCLWQKSKANQRAWLPFKATDKSSFCLVQT